MAWEKYEETINLLLSSLESIIWKHYFVTSEDIGGYKEGIPRAVIPEHTIEKVRTSAIELIDQRKMSDGGFRADTEWLYHISHRLEIEGKVKWAHHVMEALAELKELRREVDYLRRRETDGSEKL